VGEDDAYQDHPQTHSFTADTALRLSRYFKTNAEFWLNLQNFFDLEEVRRTGAALEIERRVQPPANLAS
jgi:plasmid maintenance system antidote protein VapI